VNNHSQEPFFFKILETPVKKEPSKKNLQKRISHSVKIT
jgi:hypothetical protein